MEEFQECLEQLEEHIIEGDQVELPILSFHAIKGSQSPYTIRFEAKIGKISVIFLVDSGSTYNFLSASLMTRLLLPVYQQHQLKVTVVDGRQLFTRGIYHNVSWEVQKVQYSIEFMVSPLKGCVHCLEYNDFSHWALLHGILVQ